MNEQTAMRSGIPMSRARRRADAHKGVVWTDTPASSGTKGVCPTYTPCFCGTYPRNRREKGTSIGRPLGRLPTTHQRRPGQMTRSMVQKAPPIRLYIRFSCHPFDGQNRARMTENAAIWKQSTSDPYHPFWGIVARYGLSLLGACTSPLWESPQRDASELARGEHNDIMNHDAIGPSRQACSDDLTFCKVVKEWTIPM